MYLGGLKKWMPQNRDRSAAGTAADNAASERPDVLEASTACSPICAAIFS
jgi:hypothetical protein